MSDPENVKISDWLPGDSVPFHLAWYIVLSSYFVSLAGALTTVELLHRRKPGNSWLSWLQLGACAVSFGLVAIWCMHFVGNRAIVLGNGEPELQLYYNPSFTALSVFLPIIFLFGAFVVAELKKKKSRLLFLYLCLSGFVTGLSITGMHYIGNFGIVNYDLHNPVSHIVGAAVIAIISCIIALTLFFLQREMWINSLWRRVVCAIVLASAVSGMHWVASIGTRYILTQGYDGPEAKRNTNLIVAVVMAALACLVCVLIAWDSQRRRREIADNAQQVGLALVTLDPEGRFLVTSEGLLPSQKVTRQFNQRSFEDEFNQSHPVFQWLYRMSHNWSSVLDLIPIMRQHLLMTGSIKEYRPGSSSSRSSSGEDESNEEYSVIFRELFCVAAMELAHQLDEPLNTLGTLHESIMQTGKITEKNRKSHKAFGYASMKDPEKGTNRMRANGKGQLLFLARSIDRTGADRLIASGFRFATLSQVGNIMARSMLVTVDELVSTMEEIRATTENEKLLPEGRTYVSCFAIRAALREVRSSTPKWAVLVPKDAPAQLPSVELCARKLGQSEMSVISQLDGMTAPKCIEQLLRLQNGSTTGVSSFALTLRDTILELIKKVSEPFFLQAIFCAKPLQQLRSGDGNEKPATIFSFYTIPDVHTIALTSPELIYTSLSFFKVRQQVIRSAPDHAILARRVHQEFSSLAARKDIVAATANAAIATNLNRRSTLLSCGKRCISYKSTACQNNSSDMSLRTENSSKLGLVNVQSQNSEPATARFHNAMAVGRSKARKAKQPWSGIMVHSDVTVDANLKEDTQTENTELGNKAEASVAEEEQPTFVDELFRITCTRFQRER